ncbi:hypothetical protein GW796_08430 [archaeon]|nr:hypothetical protein [archaeon]
MNYNEAQAAAKAQKQNEKDIVEMIDVGLDVGDTAVDIGSLMVDSMPDVIIDSAGDFIGVIVEIIGGIS